MGKHATLVFQNYEAFDYWAGQFDYECDYDEIPVAVDDGWTVSADVFVPCMMWDTALRRFKKAFKDINSEIAAWVDHMRDLCADGVFSGESDNPDGPLWSSDRFSWKVERHGKRWYVCLSISGEYAGRCL